MKESPKITQFDDNIYVFTPKGDIIELAKEATVLDFAYEIHTELGHDCTGATVNGKIEKLSYKLKGGDQVKVRTLRPKKKPSPDWLEIVKTEKARYEIRRALKG